MLYWKIVDLEINHAHDDTGLAIFTGAHLVFFPNNLFIVENHSLEFSVNQFDEYMCTPGGKRALNASTSARLLEKLYISKFCLNKNGKTKRSCKQEYTCSTRKAILNLDFHPSDQDL